MRSLVASMIIVLGFASLVHAAPSEPTMPDCKIGITYNDLDSKTRGEIVEKLGRTFGNPALEETDAILTVTRTDNSNQDGIQGVLQYESGQKIGFNSNVRSYFLRMVPTCAQLAALQTMSEQQRNKLGYFTITEKK